MGKTIKFIFDNQIVHSEITKVDRKKIYGWTTTVVFDEQGEKCEMAGLADGKYVLPSGSTSQVILTAAGESVSRSTLVGVDSEGVKVEIVPSVYDGEIYLSESCIEDYLSCAVKAVYQLTEMDNKATLLDALNAGKIYRFIFNYRADYEGDDAFLVSNENEVFAVVGKVTHPEFIGLEQADQNLSDQENEEESDEDIDFAMF